MFKNTLKTYLMIFVIFFFVGLFAGKVFAHEWNGDDWAKRQYAFAQHVIYCSKNNNCNISELASQHINLSKEISNELKFHSQSETVGQFIEEHFTNTTLAITAMQSVPKVGELIKTMGQVKIMEEYLKYLEGKYLYL